MGELPSQLLMMEDLEDGEILPTVKCAQPLNPQKQPLSFNQLAMVVQGTQDSTADEQAAGMSPATVLRMKSSPKPSLIPSWREEAQEWAQEIIKKAAEWRRLLAQRHGMAR